MFTIEALRWRKILKMNTSFDPYWIVKQIKLILDTCLVAKRKKSRSFLFFLNLSYCSPQSLCPDLGLCRKCRCQSSLRVHVRRCTRQTPQTRWTSWMTWCALDTSGVARTPARYCWISCLCCCVYNSQIHACIHEQRQELCKPFLFEHFNTSQWWKLNDSVFVFSGWFRRAPCLSDKWDLGAGWGGEFWTGLCSVKQARCVCQTDQLHKLHPQHGTGHPAVWSS